MAWPALRSTARCSWINCVLLQRSRVFITHHTDVDVPAGKGFGGLACFFVKLTHGLVDHPKRVDVLVVGRGVGLCDGNAISLHSLGVQGVED